MKLTSKHGIEKELTDAELDHNYYCDVNLLDISGEQYEDCVEDSSVLIGEEVEMVSDIFNDSETVIKNEIFIKTEETLLETQTADDFECIEDHNTGWYI